METSNLAQDLMTEQQAAQLLGISVDALYRLLDQHIFNNGSPRPANILFTQSDLLLLSYWCDNPKLGKVVAMPCRRH